MCLWLVCVYVWVVALLKLFLKTVKRSDGIMYYRMHMLSIHRILVIVPSG